MAAAALVRLFEPDVFKLIDPMIFGPAKTISRKHDATESCELIVFDLTEVEQLGVTASLAIENAVRGALEKKRNV